MGVPVAAVEFSMTTAGVDWPALKDALNRDDFDNGRTPEEYRISHDNSFAVAFVLAGGEYVGNGRVLSDGVCNAYLVDIWTATPWRRRGIGSEIVRRLIATVPGQHVLLLTDERADFYATLGFRETRVAMATVVGSWLSR
jgi:GNAT superfamily N-acetyltransferase